MQTSFWASKALSEICSVLGLIPDFFVYLFTTLYELEGKAFCLSSLKSHIFTREFQKGGLKTIADAMVQFDEFFVMIQLSSD